MGWIRGIWGLLLGLSVMLAGAAQVAAEEARRPALLADKVVYDAARDALIASGNVEVYFEDRVLRAQKITYFNETGSLEAEGPIVLTAPGEDTLLADGAALDGALSAGLIQGARIVLAENFQIAATQAERVSPRYSVLRNTVASSCQVCAGQPTPLWLIRARRIVRDNEEKQLHFENVRFEVMGATLAVLPYFRMPDPTVKRASGFLQPLIRNADTFGTGIKLPYFLVLDDHSDVTITPFFTTRGTALIEGQYRRAYRSGDLSFDGAFALDERNTQGGMRGFVYADGAFDLGARYKLDFELRRAGDKSFLSEFGFSDTDRLTSYATVFRQRPDRYVSFSATSYQSLRASEDDTNIPVVAPEVSYNRFWDDAAGGRISAEGDVLGLTRKLGRDVFKIGGNVSWERLETLPFGLRGQALAGLGGWAYRTEDDASFSADPKAYLAPTAALDLRWPLIRRTEAATQVIEPVAQLVYRDTWGDLGAVPNEDSLQIEFDASNLFALERAPGTDLVEEGLRLNLGANFTHLSENGWAFGLTMGRVYRDRTLSQFAAGTGLNGRSSNFVAAVNLDLPPVFSLSNQTLFDDALSFSRNDIQARLDLGRFEMDANYVFLQPDATANSLEQRHELRLNTEFDLSENWSMGLSVRRNLAAGRDVERNLRLTYGNECVTTDFSLSRRFTNSNNIAPSSEFGLSISLVGFGGNERTRPAHACRGP